ncbi:MAG: hypothetical protein ACFFCS_28015 [Candidatus Hodarchaeota archaeon]
MNKSNFSRNITVILLTCIVFSVMIGKASAKPSYIGVNVGDVAIYTITYDILENGSVGGRVVFEENMEFDEISGETSSSCHVGATAIRTQKSTNGTVTSTFHYAMYASDLTTNFGTDVPSSTLVSPQAGDFIINANYPNKNLIEDTTGGGGGWLINVTYNEKGIVERLKMDMYDLNDIFGGNYTVNKTKVLVTYTPASSVPSYPTPFLIGISIFCITCVVIRIKKRRKIK